MRLLLFMSVGTPTYLLILARQAHSGQRKQADHGELQPCSDEGHTEENVLSSCTDPHEYVDHGDYDAYAGSVDDDVNVTDGSSVLNYF